MKPYPTCPEKNADTLNDAIKQHRAGGKHTEIGLGFILHKSKIHKWDHQLGQLLTLPSSYEQKCTLAAPE